MAKETKKQIKAQVINDVQKQFARKVADGCGKGPARRGTFRVGG